MSTNCNVRKAPDFENIVAVYHFLCCFSNTYPRELADDISERGGLKGFQIDIGKGKYCEKTEVIYQEIIVEAVQAQVRYTMPKPCWAVMTFKVEPGKLNSGVVGDILFFGLLSFVPVSIMMISFEVLFL